MATTAPNKDAAKAAKLREMAKDKTLPQDVRNQYLDQANTLEEKAAKDSGVRMAKGGAVKPMPMRGERTATNKAKKMAVGGSVQQLLKLQQALPSQKAQPAQPAQPAQEVRPAQKAQPVSGMKPGAIQLKAPPVSPAIQKPSGKPMPKLGAVFKQQQPKKPVFGRSKSNQDSYVGGGNNTGMAKGGVVKKAKGK